jgi:hypothetical protein
MSAHSYRCHPPCPPPRPGRENRGAAPQH